MAKAVWSPATILAPVPVVFVGCGTLEHPNVLTVAWTGIVNSNPAMTYVSIRPQRYSHNIIESTGEFTINLATSSMCRALDSCGVYTGAKADKFRLFGLNPEKGAKVAAPLIKQSPISLECRVTKIIPLGTHDMFLAEIAAVDVDETLIDENGKLCMSKAKLVAYSHGDYLELGRKIGSFGFSVKKKLMRP
ncbi:MAG: flavin reductase family protein [Oscillospiraceae bacterium]|nr:flavin reductase family protein [Oscillospiraceae bacterium]